MIAFRGINPAVAALGVVTLLATIGLLATPYYLLAVLVAPGFLGALLLLRSPWLGIFAIIALIPFDAFLSFGGPLQSLTIPKLLGVSLLGIAALFIVMRRLRLEILFCNLWPWLMGFAAVGLISALFSTHPSTAADEIRQLITAYLMLVLGLIFLQPDERTLERLTTLVVISIGFSAALSIAGYLFSIPGLSMGTEEDALKRATGASGDPNVFSSYVLFGLPLIFFRLFDPETKWLKMFYLGTLLLCLAALVLTFSRGGTLIMVIILGLVAWEYRTHIKVRHLGLVFLLILVATWGAFFTIPESYWERQATMVSGEQDRSLGRRSSYLVVGARAFLDAPLLGHGPGAFPEIYGVSPEAQTFVTSWNPDPRRHAHNTYLEVLIGYGGLGLAAFLGFAIQVLRNFSQANRLLAAVGETRMAALVRAHRLSLISMLLYFLIISQSTVKYLWIWAAVSVIVLRLAQKTLQQAGQPIP